MLREEVTRCRIEGVRVGQEGCELEHVSLVVQEFALKPRAFLGAELAAHYRVSSSNGQAHCEGRARKTGDPNSGLHHNSIELSHVTFED